MNDDFSSYPLNFCCSGHTYCKLKTAADPMRHLCPICMKGVHVICGVPNTDFENGKVGICYLTIYMKCHVPEKISDKYAPNQGNSETISEK